MKRTTLLLAICLVAGCNNETKTAGELDGQPEVSIASAPQVADPAPAARDEVSPSQSIPTEPANQAIPAEKSWDRLNEIRGRYRDDRNHSDSKRNGDSK